jgi:hypothetical protein
MGCQSPKENRFRSMKRQTGEGENMAVVPYLNQKPKNKIERRAFDDLEKIRKKREGLKKKKEKEEEKLHALEEKKKKRLKKQIELRRVKLGIKKK